MAGKPPPGNPAAPRRLLRRLLPLYGGVALGCVLLGSLLSYGGAWYDENRFTKATRPSWAWSALEQDLLAFHRQYHRWPATLHEFYRQGKAWTRDGTSGASRLQNCAGDLCTAFENRNYLYLYQSLPNGAASLWMLPQSRLPADLPFSYREQPAAAVRAQAQQWQEAAVYYFAACLPPAAQSPARCRLWAGQLPPLTPEARAALVQHREEALWHTLTPAQQAAPPEPDVAHYLAREREQPMRWLVTPPEAAAQFQPTPAWLAQHSLLEVLPHATPTPAN